MTPPVQPAGDDLPARPSRGAAVLELGSSEELLAHAGQEIGVSGWLTVDQARIDAFAETTEDRQWIHTDPEQAKAGPFGAPIAHGYLTLSLVPCLTSQVFAITTPGPKVNYGLNRVRFPAPVVVDSRIRARVAFADVQQVSGGLRVTIDTTVEIEGSGRPACVAQSVVLVIA